MHNTDNIVSLADYRDISQQDLIDDISARAFLFMRDAAAEQQLPLQQVIVEHLYGIAQVVQAVEGTVSAQRLLAEISAKIALESPQ